MNIDNLNDNQLNDSPVFEPDFSVTYPNKQELYRKETTSPVIMIKQLMVAASLVLTAGLIWWLTDNQRIEQPVALIVPEVKNASVEKKSIEEITQATVIRKSSVAKKTAMSKKAFQANISVVADPIHFAINNDQEITSHSEVVQQEIVNVQVEQPKSNFSADALQAAAQLTGKDVSVVVVPSKEKAEVYIPMTVESERKRPFRGIVRKLSRTILGEGESLGEEDVIRVANFKIPVSN